MGRLPVAGLKALYLTLMKNDTAEHDDRSFDVLESLSADVDADFPDELVRRETDGINEDELRERARIALERLRSLGTGNEWKVEESE